MEANTREQARFLFETIEFLRGRFAPRLWEVFTEHDAARTQLTLTQHHMLAVVRKYGPVTIKDLARVLAVSSPSVSVMVDRLVDMGLVNREPGQDDRRVVQVTITTRGSAIIGRMEEIMVSSISDLLEELGPECARKWHEVYERIREVLVEKDAHAATTSPEE
ncbi:MAG TPA: MarR family transcriptional regulator [Candidatus Hydrogenedentes bacterium]|nr:MarR family transcriptional regulator [Candidatus Hydrogenedentota bacterium]HPG67688.1 MarR family transcriptional regulator [Candidatus Hydrogenedentota bacterium]